MSVSLSICFALCLSVSLSLSFQLSFSPSPLFSFPLSLSLAFCFSVSLCLSLSLSLSHSCHNEAPCLVSQALWGYSPGCTSVGELCPQNHNKMLNSLPNDKILDRSKLKPLADDKINVTEKLKFVLGRVENIVGKGENAGYLHFLLFPQRFQKASYNGSFKFVVVW